MSYSTQPISEKWVESTLIQSNQKTATMKRSGLTSLLIFSCVLGMMNFALAQDDEGSRPPAVPVAGGTDDSIPPASMEGDGVADDAPAAMSKDDADGKVIYIPFKDLDGAFENPDANVVIPYAEYIKLLKNWQQQQLPQSTPDAVITKSDYVVTIDDELARIKVTFAVNVLGKPWVEIPIQFGQAAVGKVTGENVLLRGIGDGQYALLFGQAGEQTVEIELAARVHQSPDGRSFEFAVPPVAVTTLDVTVPRKDQSIEIQPRIVGLPVDNADGDVTRAKANLGSTNKIAVEWHPQVSLKPEMNLLASVTNETLVTVEDGLIHNDAYLTYEILRGKLETLRVAVPKSQRILDVTSNSRIKSWKTNTQGDKQIVDIELLAGVEGKVTVEIHTEEKLTNETFHPAGMTEDGQAFGIHALDAVRESGQIAVRHGSDLSLTVVEQKGVVRIQESEVDQRLKGNNALTYKFYSPVFNFEVAAKPVEPRIMVTHNMTHTFQDDELQVVSQLQYTIERAGVFEFQIKLPENLKVDNVQCQQMKEFNVDDGASTLTIALRERSMGVINVTVKAHRDLAEVAEESQKLPFIEPQNVERETGTVVVYAKESMEVVTDQDGIVSAQPLPANLQPRVGNTVLNSVWGFTRRPLEIPVSIKRKPTRLSATVATTIDVQPELTEVSTNVLYNIEYAGVDTFRFEVPEAVSTDLRIELVSGDNTSAPIKQKTASDAIDGWVTWTVITQREVLGLQQFLVSYDVKNDKTETIEADATPADDASEDDAVEAVPTIEITALRPLGLVDEAGTVTTSLSRTQGEVVVKKERTLSISGTATGGSVEAIDLRELTLLPQDGALAYRYFKDSAEDRVTVSLTQTRHEIQEVVSTIVSRGLVEVVTDKDAEATYRSRFRVKTTERQRLLVNLPINLEVLGAFVNDREVKLEKATGEKTPGELWAPFWLNVARTESSETPFLVTFQFLWKVKPALGESQYGRGRMSLPLPVIGAGSTVMQELKVVVWIPEEYALVGDPGRFDLEKQGNLWSIFSGTLVSRQTDHLEHWSTEGQSCPTGFVQFPTEGRVPYVYTNLGGANAISVVWWNKLSMTLIFSIAIAIIGWILVRTSWENKLGILLLAAFIAALFGLRDSHALSAGLQVARYGVAFLLGLWLIHGLFAWTKETTHTPPRDATQPKSVLGNVPYAVAPPPGVFDDLRALTSKQGGTQ